MSERKLLLATTMVVGMMIGAAFPAAAQDKAVDVEELVITGSHLSRTAFDSPSPVDVIDPDNGRLEGLFDGAALLQTSPIGAGSVQLTGLVTGMIQNGGPGVSTLSLRGLGDQRTLMLMNGRRLPPAGVQGLVGAVDLNILPSAAIERYEVLKDGASSVYGSDAVAGVVNIITRRNLDGAVLTADGTASEAGGGEEYRLSGAFGRVFDAGDFQVSAEWYRREALTQGDRSWLDCGEPYTFDPATGARSDLIDPATGKPKCLSTKASVGYINVYTPFGAFYARRTPGAGADPFTPGYRAISLAEIDFDPQAEDGATVLPSIDRYTVFAEGRLRRGGYEGYGEFLFSRRESNQERLQSIGQPVSPLAPCSANPFSFFCPGAGLVPLTPFLATREEAQRVDVARTVLGVRGDVPGLEGWGWDAHLSYSRSHGEYERTGVYADRMYFVTGVDGDLALAPICPPEAPAGCSPLNFFTPEIIATGMLPQSYLDYLTFREMGETDYDQFIAEAVITGDLFQVPAGPVAAAFGLSFRKDWLDDSPGPQAVAGNYWGSATAGRTKGEDSVSEAFAEVGVPVTTALDLNLSGRYSNYDSYGANGTYKAGLNWKVIDTLRVRATYGTSFRAPALYEMFLNDQTAFLPQSALDPCIRWNESSNPALQANCSNPAEPLGNLPVDFGGLGIAATIVAGGG